VFKERGVCKHPGGGRRKESYGIIQNPEDSVERVDANKFMRKAKREGKFICQGEKEVAGEGGSECVGGEKKKRKAFFLFMYEGGKQFHK